jgi:large subunit ribosomal protein L16
MLSPKRVKWRKVQKGKMRGKATRGHTVFFGEFGLQATECGRITSRQIEAARVAMTRYVKRGGQVWVRVFPDKPITKKAAETRMGSGKGNVEEWAAVIRPGRIIYEMAGISKAEATEALRLASHKLPLHCKVIGKQPGARTAAMIATAPKKAAAPAPAAPKEATANG